MVACRSSAVSQFDVDKRIRGLLIAFTLRVMSV